MSPLQSVKALFLEIKEFIKKDFHPLAYLFTFSFIAICIWLNYSTGFYAKYIRTSYFRGESWWVFPLFYATFYVFIAVSTLLLRKEYKTLKNPKVYIKSLFIILLYGTSIGAYSYRNWQFPALFGDEIYFLIRILSQLKSVVIYFIPLIIYKFLFDKKIEGLYGLSSNSKHIKGYITLFLFLLPFVIAISYTPDFQQAYPQFHPWQLSEVFGLKTWQFTALFQISYGIDFIMTEFLFRGVLVIGMMNLLGRKAILPMVAMYAAIHFGKPLGETISSVFGGYILGALAYQTRHIWGGVLTHIAIAVSMEFMGVIQHYTK